MTNLRWPRSMQGLVSRFARERRGQVAILFALALIPMLFSAGAAVDYLRYTSAKARLDATLDAVILSVISQKSNTVVNASLLRMDEQFRAEAAKVPGVDPSTITFSVTPVVTATTLNLTASYSASVKTTLASMMNVTSLQAKNTAAGQRKLAQYIDFYLLLDNSPSMGLAATDADIVKMKNATKGNSRLSGVDKTDGCAFACHLHTFDNKGKITGDDPNDFYNIAKKNGVKLRIQVLREAVENLVDTAKQSMTLPNQFRMEIWTFAENPNKVSSLSTNLDSTKTNAAQIDLAYSLYGEPDNQTAYERALDKMNDTVPASGDGITPATPIKFLFFVTDGVQDTPIDGAVSNPKDGKNVNSNRFIGPINPADCKALKDKGVRIGIIYTTYLPLYNNSFYNSYVKPFEAKIPDKLSACASDGLFFQVSTGGDINAAMQKLFATALASVRLTN